MILDKIGYSYQDLTIIPETITNINSRSKCNPFISSTEVDHNGMLPIFASPMSTITNEKNIDIWKTNRIMPIIPRNIDLIIRTSFMQGGEWVALSLNEFKEYFVDSTAQGKKGKTYRICVDLANGHMKSLYTMINTAKELSKENGYNLIIMTGNIANPETYKWIAKNVEVDYIRLSIGTGNNCFVDGTKITLSNGCTKNIEDIKIGDSILTIDGTYQKVENTLRFKTNKQLIKINNEITSTNDHKFFVINKSDKNKVNEQNLQKYGYWVEANKLNKNEHLLVKRYRE